MKHTETQIGWHINIFFILVIILFPVLYLFQIGTNPTPLFLTIIFTLIFIVVFLIFYKLSISIDGDYIRITYGIGIIQKNIKITDIASVKKVRNKWYYGWGIRFIGKGWLYNISGLDAIELSFKNKSSIDRIRISKSSNLGNKLNQIIAK